MHLCTLTTLLFLFAPLSVLAAPVTLDTDTTILTALQSNNTDPALTPRSLTGASKLLQALGIKLPKAKPKPKQVKKPQPQPERQWAVTPVGAQRFGESKDHLAPKSYLAPS